ncbi:MAG: YcaO-like family protein, partial [Candidatus Uhrbacteria bacterium]|nr:YcaO-like family protein [Candidatus Uhrbacteria bacterium]
AERLRSRDGTLLPLPQPNKSHVLEVIGMRQSIRTFQAKKIPGEQLSGLLRAVYGTGSQGHWSVPSGGGLYPLDIYLLVPSSGQAIGRGLYRWDPEKHELHMISNKNPSMWLVKVFNVKALLEHVACIVCIAANLKRSTAKYANRGYRYTLLEAGHAAQNAYLYCAEQNLGVVEYGGFQDEPLAHELGLNYPAEAVITTLITGVKTGSLPRALSPSIDQVTTETAFQLRQTLIGQGKPIAQVFFLEPSVDGYAMPRWAATALYRPPYDQAKAPDRKRSRASGVGFTSSEAEIKALAEGFERYAAECPRVDRVQSAKDLKAPFLDPRRVVPYTERQFRLLDRLEPFDPSRKIEWVIGTQKNMGQSIWVPAELVFYGPAILRRQGRKPCYPASSNGVAAHFDARIAVESALYELAERDAISVTWYAKRQVHAVAYRSLPSDLQARISPWKNFGYRVSILNVTVDGPPVALALIWSREKTPALIAGAGSRVTFHEAVTKAFDEAELLAMSWHRLRPKRNMRPSDVRSVTDHGRFYIDPKNLVHAQWLLDAEETTALPDD